MGRYAKPEVALMQYRLRTLLIVITAAGVYLAWVGYCRRMAVFHREQSSQFISQVANREGWTREKVENRISDLFIRLPNEAAQIGNPEFVKDEGWEPVYASAAAHEGMTRKYDRAALYPWTMLAD